MDHTTTRVTRSTARRLTWRERTRLIGWPVGLLLLLVLLAAWRAPDDGDGNSSGRAAEPDTRVETRRFGDLRLRVPTGWVTLDRTADHVTWGEAGRLHTVTLASTEASILPLPGVVAAVSRESASALPGASPEGRPQVVDLPGPAGRDDSAVAAGFRVADDSGGELRVAQVWRRDARAGLDIVATWTSADGQWPLPAQSRIPLPAVSG
ncbi:MAG: hypothetical protein JWM86_663 [Thermoleophilia bacterium]|nr:hypothetical protein [Thermoleophilia bacterium]